MGKHIGPIVILFVIPLLLATVLAWGVTMLMTPNDPPRINCTSMLLGVYDGKTLEPIDQVRIGYDERPYDYCKTTPHGTCRILLEDGQRCLVRFSKQGYEPRTMSALGGNEAGIVFLEPEEVPSDEP